MLAEWTLAEGNESCATTPADLFRLWRDYRTEDVSPLVTQDILLLARTRDHYGLLELYLAGAERLGDHLVGTGCALGEADASRSLVMR